MGIAENLVELESKIMDYISFKYGLNLNKVYQIYEGEPISINSLTAFGNPLPTDNVLLFYTPMNLDTIIKGYVDKHSLQCDRKVLSDINVLANADILIHYYTLSDMIYVVRNDDIVLTGYDRSNFIQILEQVTRRLKVTALPGMSGQPVSNQTLIKGSSNVDLDVISKEASKMYGKGTSSRCDCGSRITHGVDDYHPAHSYWCGTKR